jgi:hypothetical protein
VATLDYIANGGDGFEAMKGAPSLLKLGNRIDELMFDDCSEAMPSPVGVVLENFGPVWGAFSACFAGFSTAPSASVPLNN